MNYEFCENGLGSDIRNLTKFSRQRIDLVHFAFDDKGDDGDGAFAEGKALSRKHNIGMRGDDFIHLRSRSSV